MDRRIGLTLVTVVVLTACGTVGPTATAVDSPSPPTGSPGAPGTGDPSSASPLRLGAPEDPIVGGIFGAGRSTRLFAGVAFGSGFVVGGEHIVSEEGPVEAVIWASADGVSWVQANAGDDGFHDAQVTEILTDGDVLLAVGFERFQPESTYGSNIPITWRSDDGLTWQRIEPMDSDLERLRLRGAFGDADGFIVSGRISSATIDQVVVSEDGVDWTPIDPVHFAESDVIAVARSANGYVAVGESRPCVDRPTGEECRTFTEGPARAWWSPDGVTWELAEIDRGDWLYGVFPLAHGVFAIGSLLESDPVPSLTHWRSDDGRSWSVIEENQPTRTAFASDGRTLVIWDRSASEDFGYTGPGLMRASTNGMTWHEIGTVDTGDLTSDNFVIGANGVLVVLYDRANRDAGVQFIPFS